MNDNFLENKKLWCHAKNFQAFKIMLKNRSIHCFWHQKDDYTMTSQGYIWTYPGKKLVSNAICVMPERHGVKKSHPSLKVCAGICSDVIKSYK